MPDVPHKDDSNNNNDSNNSNSWNSTSFAAFFETWLVRQEHYLDELIFAETNYDEQTQEQELRALISRVFSHYQQYYEAKTLALRNNVFHVFSPSWFSSLEQSLLWIGGFKPALAFRLVGYSVSDLTEEQSERMELLRSETRTAEKELEEEMAIVQESVAAPPMLEMARRAGRLVDRDRRIGVDSVLATLRNSMELLVESADLLRATTTRKVIEILTPVQGIRLLIAAAQLQLRVRMWGFQRDAMERARSP